MPLKPQIVLSVGMAFAHQKLSFLALFQMALCRPDKPIILGFYCCEEVQSIIMAGKQGSIQADMMLEKELRVLHVDPQAARTGLFAAGGGA